MDDVGWDVATTDCLAAHVARRVKYPVSPRIVLLAAGLYCGAFISLSFFSFFSPS